METSKRQDKRDSKKKQSSYSVYSSKHVRIQEELQNKHDFLRKSHQKNEHVDTKKQKSEPNKTTKK